MTFIKKVMVVLSVVLLFVFLVGCIDYKAYDMSPQGEDDLDLLNEIAQIEEELNLVDNLEELEELEEEKETVEEIVLPDLEEEIEEVKGDLQVITVDENELIKLNVKVSDPDEDTVTYSFTPPLNDQGEWKTNFGDSGEYLVTLRATDGVHTTEKKIRIVVNRFNAPPVIGLVEDITVKEGETVSFEPEVSDPNNDPVSVTLSEPLNGGTFMADHTSAGEYQIKVVASDGELEVEKTFKLVIEDVNELPVMTNLGDITIEEGEVVKVEPEVTDLDGDTVETTISVTCLSGCQFLKPGESAGEYNDELVWETSCTDHGIYKVKVTANDGKDTSTKEITLTIEDENCVPVFGEVTAQIN